MKSDHIWLHHLAIEKTITYIETKCKNGTLSSSKVFLDPDTLSEICRIPEKELFPTALCIPGYTATEEYECFDTLEAFYTCRGIGPAALPSRIPDALPYNILILEEISVGCQYLFLALVNGHQEALCAYESQTKNLQILTDSLCNGSQLYMPPSGIAVKPDYILRYPQNFQPDARYPTVCLIIESHTEDTFPPLLEAADDFIRNQCFVLWIPVPHELSDALAVVKHAISLAHQEEKSMNRDRLALFGQHFSGYVVHMLIASDFHTVTAITYDGIANATGCGGISTEFKDTFDFKSLWEISPMKYARHFKVPMLLLTNPADRRYGNQEVPTLFQMLLDQKTPARMIVLPSRSQYPDTAASWHIYFEEITSWIYRYLKEDS